MKYLFISFISVIILEWKKTIDIHIFILSPIILQIILFMLVVYWGPDLLSVHKYDYMVNK